MNPISRYLLDARARARRAATTTAPSAPTAEEGLLAGDYTDLHPALVTGARVVIVGQSEEPGCPDCGESDYRIAVHVLGLPNTIVLAMPHQIVRPYATAADLPYDHQRDGL